MNMEILKHQFDKIERLRYLVDNEWRQSKTTKYMPVMDPSTGKQIAEAPCCTQDVYSALLAVPAVKRSNALRVRVYACPPEISVSSKARAERFLSTPSSE